MKNSFIITMLLTSNTIFSQNNVVTMREDYKPRFFSYFGIVHPLSTLQNKQATINFKNNYTVGLPTGIILRKSNNYAYSFEIIPFIRYENESSKLANLVLHPGIIFYLKNKINITPRLAFETTGRYGFSAIASKTIIMAYSKPVNIHLGALFRFGLNQYPTQSIALGFSIGL